VSARRGAAARLRVERVVAGAAPAARVRDDAVATEEPLELRIATAGGSAHRVAVTMRTPGNDFDLAAGFLFSEGLVGSADGIASIRYCTDAEQRFNVVTVTLAPGVGFDPELLSRNFYTTSSCGVCGKASIEAALGPECAPIRSALALDPDVLVALPERLREAQRLFATTGGVHGAGLFTAAGELVRIREDVGRHNALDKLIGAALIAGELPLHDRVAVVSGRVSFELVQKAARAGIPVLAGVSAPSSLAVELARTSGMTLAGFVRDPGFNVYAGSRIAAAPQGNRR
jgi:FdhD protein